VGYPVYRWYMDRRLMGALLVVAVVAVAIVVPARDGLRLAGTASMVAFPPDPVVGDCLIEPAADFWDDARQPLGSISQSQTAASGTRNPFAPVFGGCHDGPVVGEVVAILSAVGDQQAIQRQIAGSGLDCRSAALGYAGLIPLDDRYSVEGALTVDPVRWRFSIDLRGVWVLPSRVLQAAGRSWAACVAAPGAAESYRGSVAGAYRLGQLPDAFGTCWDRPESSPGIQSVACDEPHQAELISTGTVPVRADTTSADIRRSCEALAGRVMRRADPTADGGITVRLSPETSDAQVRRAPTLDVVCFITPSEHSLAGTVVGLGASPIPYAG